MPSGSKRADHDDFGRVPQTQTGLSELARDQAGLPASLDSLCVNVTSVLLRVKRSIPAQACAASHKDIRNAPSVCLVASRQPAECSNRCDRFVPARNYFNKRACSFAGGNSTRALCTSPEYGSNPKGHPELSNGGGFHPGRCTDDSGGEMASGLEERY